MKAILTAAWIVGATVLPMLSLAQAWPLPVRAQAVAQMRQSAEVGYGGGGETTYPNDVEAGPQRVDRRADEPQTSADVDGYGVQPGTTSESGSRQPTGPASP